MAITVLLPVVALEWEDLGPTPDTLGRKLRLRNKGDTLTDLSITSSTPDATLAPSVEHGLLQTGDTLEVTVRPRLYDGFQGVEAAIVAHSLDKTVEHTVTLALEENQQIFGVQLMPGHDPTAEEDSDLQRLRMRARALAGAFLNPDVVDWTQRQMPEDADGDGRVDRWSITDEDEGILWIGDDTDGDAEIDFVHADIGSDGQFDYSAFKTADGWDETNLMEAWLEMGFSLPWARNRYEKHDVDIVVNGVVIASLTDAIPEGNYAFRIPPTALKIGPTEGNRVEIRSTHLRGGHYVIASSFRIKTRLTSTRVWVAAGSKEEAHRLASQAEGLSLSGCDYSVSSSEMRTNGELRMGAEAFVTVPIRNIGATRTAGVEVALLRAEPGGTGVELARTSLEGVPLIGSTLARIPWEVGAGTHQLKIIVDPDGLADDTDRTNNESMITLTIPGDDAKPTVRVLEPADGSRLNQTVFRIRAEAKDDAGIARVEARVDNGLWRSLEPAPQDVYSGKGLLQPGAHKVTVRATDGSGNQVERTVSLDVEAAVPDVEIVSPAGGASVDARQTRVEVRCGEDAVLAAVRVNGGPWRRMPLEDGRAEAVAPLAFGKVTLEAMAANGNGAIRIAACTMSCTKQPEAQEEPGTPPQRFESGAIEIEGLGRVDLFGPANTIVPGASGAADPAGTGEATGDDNLTLNQIRANPDTRDRLREKPKGGGLVVFQHVTQSWYCTNRPKVETTFPETPQLKRGNLPRATAAESRTLTQALMEHWQSWGMDTAPLAAFEQALLNRIREMDGGSDLPGFLTPRGLSSTPPTDEEELRIWRDEAARAALAWWARTMETVSRQDIGDTIDPAERSRNWADLVRRRLEKRLDSLEQLDPNVRTAAEAAIKAIRDYVGT